MNFSTLAKVSPCASPPEAVPALRLIETLIAESDQVTVSKPAPPSITSAPAAAQQYRCPRRPSVSLPAAPEGCHRRPARQHIVGIGPGQVSLKLEPTSWAILVSRSPVVMSPCLALPSERDIHRQGCRV